MAYLWRGAHPDPPILTAKLKWNQPFPQGLSIIGQDQNHQTFYFNYPFFFWRSTYPTSEALWADLAPLIPSNAIPVLAHTQNHSTSQEILDRAAEVRQIITAWADAWRDKDINRHMAFYGDVFTTYFHRLEKPVVYSREQLYKLKKDIFQRSGQIEISVTEPICIVDPDNPDIMMAVFEQNLHIERLFGLRHQSPVFQPDRRNRSRANLEDRGQVLGALPARQTIGPIEHLHKYVPIGNKTSLSR